MDLVDPNRPLPLIAEALGLRLSATARGAHVIPHVVSEPFDRATLAVRYHVGALGGRAQAQAQCLSDERQRPARVN